ncbi:MAG: DUF1080 domain-containing protein [Bryobacterales bacterium]|nr:DUF1080 domain-containing protein [Bryobacterales bacterium]
MNWIATIAFAIAGLLAVTAIEGQEASRSAYSRDPRGWTDLMPKPGLPGWTKVPIPASGKLEPKEQGCDGRYHIARGQGLRYDGKRYKNFILHAEWRFRKLEGAPPYNGGLYFWANANGSQFYQAQTGLAGGWLFGDFPKAGERNRTNLREQMTGNRMAPVGEWNTFEVKATTQAVELWVNGGVQSRWERPPVTEGILGIEAEGFYMEFHRLAVKELP